MANPAAEVVADSEDEDMMIDPPDATTAGNGPAFGAQPPNAVNTSSGSGSPIRPMESNVSPPEILKDTRDTSFTAEEKGPHLSQPPIAVLASATENTTESLPHPAKPRPKPRPASKGPAAVTPEDINSSTSGATSSIRTSAPPPNVPGTFAPVGPIPAPAVTKSKPRPRPAWKGAVGAKTANNDAPNVPSAGPSSISTATTPIASKSSIIETASSTHEKDLLLDQIDSFSLDIAERTKLRSRARASKAQEKQPFIPPDDVIAISSGEEDELALPRAKAQTNSRASSKVPRKRTKTSHTDDVITIDPTQSSLPAPTSDPNISFGSQLPPSDPPPPSTPPAPRNSTPVDGVPGAILQTGGNASPLSSPLPTTMRKRKRPLAPAGDFDLGDDAIHTDVNPMLRSSRDEMPPPPLPFFAGSSTSFSSIPNPGTPPLDSLTPPAAEPKKSSAKAKERKRKEVEPEDREDEPPQKPKPKARKKKADSDEEDWAGDAPPKAKPKGRKKKGEDADDGLPKSKVPPRGGRKKPPSNTKMQLVVELPTVKQATVGSSPSKGSPSKRALTGGSPKSPGNNVDGPGVSALPGEKSANLLPDSSDLSPLDTDVDKDISKTSIGRDSPKSVKAAPHVEPQEDDMIRPSKQKPVSKAKGKRRAVVSSDDEEDDAPPSRAAPPASRTGKVKGKPPLKAARRPRNSAAEFHEEEESDHNNDNPKENEEPIGIANVAQTPRNPQPSSSAQQKTPFNRAPSVISKKFTPMSELIRKVNSLPGSPYSTSRPTHSPYLKASKTMLSRIAPLHPNRRSPPPAPPRPPPPKKTKKELEREEKWEMELEDSVEGWYALPEEERASLRQAKRNAELGYDD